MTNVGEALLTASSDDGKNVRPDVQQKYLSLPEIKTVLLRSEETELKIPFSQALGKVIMMGFQASPTNRSK